MKPNGSIRVSQSNVGRIKNQSDPKSRSAPLGRPNRTLLTSANVTHQRGRANDLQADEKTNHPSSVACDGYRYQYPAR